MSYEHAMQNLQILTGYAPEDVIVLDTETTGLSTNSDEMVSIAITDIYGNRLFYSLIRPTRHSSWDGAQRIHGISPQMVAQSPTGVECADVIRGYVRSGKLIVGYNTRYDIAIIRNSVPGIGDLELFDVMRQYATVHGDEQFGNGRYKWSKLVECASTYGYEFSAHDALEDARATAHCMRCLLADVDYVDSAIGGAVTETSVGSETLATHVAAMTSHMTTTTTRNMPAPARRNDETHLTSKVLSFVRPGRHGCLWWLFVGIWWFPLKLSFALFAIVPALIIDAISNTRK